MNHVFALVFAQGRLQWLPRSSGVFEAKHDRAHIQRGGLLRLHRLEFPSCYCMNVFRRFAKSSLLVSHSQTIITSHPAAASAA